MTIQYLKSLVSSKRIDKKNKHVNINVAPNTTTKLNNNNNNRLSFTSDPPLTNQLASKLMLNACDEVNALLTIH